LASVEEQTFEVLPREKRAPAPKEKRGREKHNGPPIGQYNDSTSGWTYFLIRASHIRNCA